MTSAKQPTVFLTGASSGIGEATARLLLQEGYAVWGTSRAAARLAGIPGLHPIEMRLEESRSIRSAWEQAVTESGGFDIVIQNAGAGLFGSIEEVSEEEALWLWRVLVEGPLLVLKLAAAPMRVRQAGTLIGISSLAVELPMCFSSHYTAGKAAFSAFLDGLWMELQPFRVRVHEVRPGDIRTDFNEGLRSVQDEDSPYARWLAPAREITENQLKSAPPPEWVARAILRLIREARAPFLTRVGTFYQAVAAPLGARFLPRENFLSRIRASYGQNGINVREPSE